MQIYVLTAHHKSKNVTFKRCVSLVVGENIAYNTNRPFFHFVSFVFISFPKVPFVCGTNKNEISSESTKMMSEFFFSKEKNTLLYEVIRY